MKEALKNIADIFSVSTGFAFLLNVAVPLLIGLLTIAWATYRLYDLHLSVRIKQKQLGDLTHGHE